jgi:hypothetical protein
MFASTKHHNSQGKPVNVLKISESKELRRDEQQRAEEYFIFIFTPYCYGDRIKEVYVGGKFSKRTNVLDVDTPVMRKTLHKILYLILEIT